MLRRFLGDFEVWLEIKPLKINEINSNIKPSERKFHDIFALKLIADQLRLPRRGQKRGPHHNSRSSNERIVFLDCFPDTTYIKLEQNLFLAIFISFFDFGTTFVLLYYISILI